MYSRPSAPARHSRHSLKDPLINLIYKAGLLQAGRGLWAKSLTVVNYHRIENPYRSDFDSFKPNVSATPTDFNQQMDYLAKWFNVVSVRDIIAWLDGQKDLPPYAALITFDDGYLDNYTFAYPILLAHDFPALIFLATAHIGTDTPFYWDIAAYCFYHTKHDYLLFPDGREQHWSNPEQSYQLSRIWIEHMKTLPETVKETWVQRLPDLLDTAIPEGYFQKLMLNWGQVREMHKAGFEFGAHTMHHPILTRVPRERVRTEVAGSKSHIERELGVPILSFAYPNGLVSDIDGEIENIVAESGIRAAFTLMNGPSTLREVKRRPYRIRRIFISHNHTLPQYAALVSRINRYGLF